MIYGLFFYFEFMQNQFRNFTYNSDIHSTDTSFSVIFRSKGITNGNQVVFSYKIA